MPGAALPFVQNVFFQFILPHLSQFWGLRFSGTEPIQP
jgi:hypothetical protein